MATVALFAVATATCGGRSEHAETSTTSFGAERDGAAGGREEAGADAIDANLGPPLDIPGIVVWLDADNGIAPTSNGGFTWTDRSPYRHVFLSQAGDLKTHPGFGELNGHRTVAFTDINRVISEKEPTPEQKKALTFGSRFVIGMVFGPSMVYVPELDDRFVRSGYRVLLYACGYWYDPPSHAYGDPNGCAFDLLISLQSTLDFRAADLEARIDAVSSGPHRLIVSIAESNARIKLDGEAQAVNVPVDFSPPFNPNEYAPLYVGGWDFGGADLRGYRGSIGEVVIVEGGDDTTEQRLDDYLRQKFSL